MSVRPLLPLFRKFFPAAKDKRLDEVDDDADADFRIQRFYRPAFFCYTGP
jgi:hypothetical protein